eukprot:gene2274-2801_t
MKVNNNKNFKLLLNGKWKLSLETPRDKDGESITSTTSTSTSIPDILLKKKIIEVLVPGEVHVDLMKNKIIPDLYIGIKEMEYRWITQCDWRWSKEFEIDEVQYREFETIELIFDGVDTVADVFVNGNQLDRQLDNMFRVYKFANVKSMLCEGLNILDIVIRSPAKYCKEKQQQYKYEVPQWEYPYGVHHRNFLRKCACHFGWDWGPCFCPMGIYKEVSLHFYNESLDIDSLVVHQIHTNQKVDLKLRITLEHYTKRLVDGSVKIYEKGSNVEVYQVPIKICQGGNIAEVPLITIENPKLWWPLGYGEQHLYRLEVCLDNEIKYSKFIGLRSMILDTSKDEFGNRFQIVVNDLPIFAKGADWIPADHFLTRITDQRIEQLLTSVKEANMNCLRVWGGGIYETDYFYDQCDSLGILIWQDFMFGCSLYPTNPEFLENVKQEVICQTKRLGHHACIALWCGSNESEEAIINQNWKQITENPHRFTVDYYKLYIETIYPTLLHELPDSFFWPSSPSNGIDEWGKSNDSTRGDSHYWEVWHSGKPFTQYLQFKSRFLSEFGFQSLPSFRQLELALSSVDQLNITAPEMEYRQRSPPGNMQILKHTALHFRTPTAFKYVTYVSQILQAISIKAGCEHWRRMKPYCMGTLYWQLNDIWVGPSWSSIEYNGYWKALHYFAKLFYQPLLLSISENLETESIEIWLTNDYKDQEFNGSIKIETIELKSSTIVKEKYIKDVHCERLSSKNFGSFKKSDLYSSATDHIVLVSFENVNNIFYPVPFKQMNLSISKIVIEQIVKEKENVWKLLIRSNNVSIFVWVESLLMDGHFSDNGFLLLSNQPKEIYFYASTIGTKHHQYEIEPKFEIHSLRDTYY